MPAEPARIDLTSLASSYGVLRTTPAFPQVLAALERLEAAEANNTDYPEKAKDVGVVRDFADLLESRQLLLARVLVSGAIAGRLSNSNARSGVIALGLKILRERFPEALDARSHGPTAQRRVIGDARSFWGLGRTSLPAVEAVRKLTAPITVKRLEALLGDALSEIENSLPVDSELAERIQALAVRSVTTRIEKYLTKGTAIDHSSHNYTAELFASALSDTRLAASDLATMSLKDWSDQVMSADRIQNSSDQLMVAALSSIALGFPAAHDAWFQSFVSTVPDTDSAAKADEMFAQWISRVTATRAAHQQWIGSNLTNASSASASTATALLLITLPESHLTRFSPDPRTVAAVALAAEQGKRLFDVIGRPDVPNTVKAVRTRILSLLAAVSPKTTLRIAIEVERDPSGSGPGTPAVPPPTNAELNQLMAATRYSSARYVFAYGFEPPGGRTLSPAVIMPRTLADLAHSEPITSAA